jgi:hypothetical protein
MKFMLLQHYGRVEGDVPPMSEWKPEDVAAHIQFQKDLNAELRERGELVEAQALTGPDLAKIVLATDGAPAVTDGPGPDGVPLRQQIEVREVMGPIEP